MPESRGRKKAKPTPTATASTPRALKASPPWYAPLMVALLIIGLLYIVVFYVTETRYPVASIGGWNVVIGFGIIMAGFLMATRWR